MINNDKPREGLATWSAKGVPSVLSYFTEDPEYWSSPGNLPTELILLWLRIMIYRGVQAMM